MSEIKIDKWIHGMTVTGLNADTKETITFQPGASRYTQRHLVVRVQLEGLDDVRGEILVPTHDQPEIGDQFTVTFERLPR